MIASCYGSGLLFTFGFVEIKHGNQQETASDQILQQTEGGEEAANRHLSSLNQTERIESGQLAPRNMDKKIVFPMIEQAGNPRPKNNSHA